MSEEEFGEIAEIIAIAPGPEFELLRNELAERVAAVAAMHPLYARHWAAAVAS